MSLINFNSLAILILHGWLIAVLIASAITDLRQRRIPNLLTYSTVFMALVAYSAAGGWEGLSYSLGGLAIGFSILFLPYLLGGMGAGDVKLMSAVGAVLGFNQTVVCFLFIAVCGGIMAVGFMIHRRNLKNTLLKTFLSMLYLFTNKDASLLKVDKNKITQEGIPYGVAITGGVFLFLSYLVITEDTHVAFHFF